MKHVIAIIILALLAVAAMAGAPQQVSVPDQIQNTAGAISDAIAYVQAHPIAGTVFGAWAAHTEIAPFTKMKSDGTAQLAWQVIRAVLGVLTKKSA